MPWWYYVIGILVLGALIFVFLKLRQSSSQ